MARAFLYHSYDDSKFAKLAPFSSVSTTVPGLTLGTTETKTVYSLFRDMEQLRKDGKALGIVDDTVKDIGKSTEGRPIPVLKVGKNPTHKVLFTGCHHSREWISVEVPYLVAEYLIQNYKTNPTTPKEKRIKHLVDNREIWFVPLVNVDGHVFTMTGPDLLGQTARQWRPNRKKLSFAKDTTIVAPQLGGGTRSITVKAGTYTGVDVNRNYNTKTWGQETKSGRFIKTSRNPADSNHDSIWCGPSGDSEAETKLIDDLMLNQDFRASITYHSFSQLLLFPDAGAKDTFVQAVGQGMRDLIAEKGNPYSYKSGSALYPTTGDAMDCAFERSPGRPTFTPELRPADSPPDPTWGFSGLPESQIQPTFEENLGAALALINCAGFNTVPSGVTCKTVAKGKKKVCQAVENCWNVFKGWTP